MRSKFVLDDVVHYGTCIDITQFETRVYLACGKQHLYSALYGGPGSDSPPAYKPGLEVFYVYDDVDCMTCLVLEARKGGDV